MSATYETERRSVKHINLTFGVVPKISVNAIYKSVSDEGTHEKHVSTVYGDVKIVE